MKSFSKLSACLVTFLVLAMFATACSSDTEVGQGERPVDGQGNGGTEGNGGSGGSDGSGAGQGVTVRIDGPGQSSGDTEIIISLDNASGESNEVSNRETTVEGEPLDPAESARLLDRLPELEAELADQVDFNRPPETRPPPRPGATIDNAFPPSGDDVAPPADDGPLEVLRFQPEGPVDLAPFISVTFNQPMIELSTVTQVEQQDVPIEISPEMPGRWIWLGTRTARFEYEPGAIDRIPAATNYTVSVPAGTVSANGNELAEGTTFSFSTPTPQVTNVRPMHRSLPTEPTFFVSFDQRVDPEAVLGSIDLLADGQEVTIRLATGEEVNEDTTISSLAENALAERWIAFRPVEPLPTDAEIQLQVGPNVPSAEGPETSDTIETFSGRTYGPFQVVDARCGWGDRCQPGQSFNIEMSNAIDVETFDASMVTVEPDIPGLQIGVSWRSIQITGRTAGQTEYTVTLASDLTDEFGQQLGDEVSRSFRVGDADRALFRPGRALVTLDPIVDDQRLTVTSINNDELKLTSYAVNPERDWSLFMEEGWRIARGEINLPWDVVSERTIRTSGERNEFVETAIDLSSELETTGHIVVVVAPENTRQDEWRNEAFAVWVQRTKLGIDAVTDNDEVVAWITDLTTGEPIAGAEVTMIDSGSATTDADGTARLPMTGRSTGIWASHDGDTALVGEFWAESWSQRDELRWYVIDDRGLYKPGETVRIKGWVREAEFDTPSRLTLPTEGGTLSWSAQDAFGNNIGTGEATFSAQGGFDLEIELPIDITPGRAGVQISTAQGTDVNSGSTWHEINVQEFRRPDFEVSASITDDGPYLAGQPFTAEVAADYFAGGALAASEVVWNVSGSQSSYAPPNWPEFTFGVWVPWWHSFGRGFADEEFFGGFDEFGGGSGESFEATTSADGTHGLSITIDTKGKPRPVTVSAAATVFDVTRQTITGSTSALVHPSELYVGLRSDRTFVQPGERLDMDVIVTNIDGEIVADRPVSVESIRLEWQFTEGSWQEVEVPDESCAITSSDEPQVCTFRPSEGGRYRIAATVIDDNERANLSEVTRWVAGGKRPTSRRVDLENLTLIPDAENYQPGDTAEILVQSPFNDAHGLLVISRGGIDRTETFEFDDAGTALLQIPVTSDDIPGIGVQIEVAGTAPRSSNGVANASTVPRPAFASGQLMLQVPPDERNLVVDVAPRQDKLEPGADTQVDVSVTDASGEPVADAELLVIVVDEAVLSLTNYQLGDPLDAFYQQTGGLGQVFRGRSTLLLSDPPLDAIEGDFGEGDAFDDEASDAMADAPAMAMEESMEDGAIARSAPTAAGLAFEGEAGGEADAAIELRENFDALAVFEPEVTTGADGKATVEVPLPDNLTRYRVMVVATADATDAGSAESNITARLPVTVRPTPPRFANFGDVFEFPVIVQNATDDDLEVEVALRSTNLTVDGRAGTTVMVPANDRVEVRFDVSADEAGTARYQVAASAGSFADAAEGDFPVYTPATAEAFATYGVVDNGAVAQPFGEPQDVFPQFGGLEISTSSTAIAALTDAVLYLSEYRYENSDAFASRIMAIVSLDDILASFNAPELPSPEVLRGAVNSDLDRLAAMQNNDGGFPYWRRGRESIPYNTVQATHAMVIADQEGFAVDEQVLANAKFYLANIEDFYPSYYGESTRRAISAYALHVRTLAGDRDVQKASGLFERAGDDIELDVAAWLWPTLADTPFDSEIELLLNNRVTETASSATFVTGYSEQAYLLLHSQRRTDAIVLDALMTQRPDSDLVLKTVNQILAERGSNGRWNNVQENSFVLLAGAKYFEAFEDVDPDFVARAWLGDTYALEHSHEGRSTDRNLTVIPMSELVGADGAGDTDIVLSKDGNNGRLYYRLGLRYAPTDFDLDPRDQGFVVQRSYEAIDDESDVVRNDDGTWSVKAGARVRVRVTMVADSVRTHVALIDPIPAGFEIVNPELATSEPVPQANPSDGVSSRFWWYRWFRHQNFRDDRAEAFTTWLSAGSYEYTYVARATTPGTFVTPPTRAEMIYEPEVFGRSSSTTVTVTD